MVVSGVPNENGINHAGEIASMALDLVDVCHAFKIPHKPTTQLRIRAGIHSGGLNHRPVRKNQGAGGPRKSQAMGSHDCRAVDTHSHRCWKRLGFQNGL